MSVHGQVPPSSDKPELTTMTTLMALPIEALLHIIGYLSNCDVTAVTRALPYTSPLVSRKSFRRWQRLVEDFTHQLHDTFDSIENDRRQKKDISGSVNATALKAEPSEAAAFEDVYLPKILAEMGIILQDRQLIQLDDIFLSLRELGNGAGTAFSPLVDCPDPEESSRILRSTLNNILPIELVKSLLPSTISRNIDSIPFATFDLILLTGYLLFAELQPKDIISLRPRYSIQGYISEQALAEYLSYILLFLKIFGLIQACAQDIVRSTKNGTTDRVQWKFTNGSPLSGQALQILERRIESWFADFYEVQTYSVPGSQKLPLTREQQMFVDSDIRKGENRAEQVDCKTLHSVAFNALSFVNPAVDLQVKGKTVGEPQASSRRGKFARIQSAPTENEFLRNWDIDAIVEALGLTLETVAPVFTTKYDWRDGSSNWSFNNGKPTVGTADNHRNPESLARVITSGIDRFCNSRDPKPTIAHLSLGQCRTRLCNPELATTWLKFLWKTIVSGKSPLMTHDCYLKMFSLTTNLDADQATFGKYDIVMFDEAQDANPCMENIIQRQRDAAGIIIIGDPYQMIYGFRGAKNECFDDERLPPTRTFHLTKSFRFGKEIADVANLILGSVGETKLVRGGNASGPSPAVFLPPVLGYKDIAPAGQHTVIFRSNTGKLSRSFVPLHFPPYANTL
ncbi:hypothetical protein TWF788_002347 [Orbilia oligospora]|uniref:F-box domain-containing protein n=1 Tax=Orbilia oligospora TaxID=2813651 RepID=A0A7C8PBI3_ORBOL|nr:hypothetical protein TWF788_002347 [Orbilia oligospora]